MIASDELFKMIKSLTAHEKRYFKIWASKHVIGKSNHYEKLFDALDALPDDQPYDEKAFKRTLRGKSYGQNLGEDKTKLRETILKAMRVYHAEKTAEGRLLEMLHEVRFLYKKGLIKSCVAQIEKATKIAYGTENSSLIILFDNYLISLFVHNKLDSTYTAASIEEAERKVLEENNLTRMAKYIATRIVEIDATASWESCAAEADGIMQRATDMSSREDLTTYAEIHILNTQQFYLLHHHRYNECLDFTSRWLEKYEKDEHIHELYYEKYRTILSNFLYGAMMAEKFELMPATIAKIKAIEINDEREEAQSFKIVTHYELIYLLNTANYIHAKRILENIEAGLEKYARYIPHTQIVYFRFNMAVLLFMQKKYSDSLHQIHEFYYLSGKDERYINTMAMARSMEWMCHFSLGSFDILDTSLRNLKRFYKEKNLHNDFLDAHFSLFQIMMKEGGLNPTAVSPLKKCLEETEALPEWIQLKSIILSWA